MPRIQKENLSHLLRQSFCNRFDQTKKLFAKLEAKRKVLKREFVLKEHSKFGFDYHSGYDRTIFKEPSTQRQSIRSRSKMSPDAANRKLGQHTTSPGRGQGKKLKRLVRAVNRYKTCRVEAVNPKRDEGRIENDFRKVINDLDTEIQAKRKKLGVLRREQKLNKTLKKVKSPEFKRLERMMNRHQKKHKKSIRAPFSPKKAKETRGFRIRVNTHHSGLLRSPKVASPYMRVNTQRLTENLSQFVLVSPKASPEPRRRKKIRRRSPQVFTKEELEKQGQHEQFMTECLRNKLAQLEEEFNLLQKKVHRIREFKKIQKHNEDLSQQKLFELKVE